MILAALVGKASREDALVRDISRQALRILNPSSLGCVKTTVKINYLGLNFAEFLVNKLILRALDKNWFDPLKD